MNKTVQTIGLALRAGKLVSGDEAVLKAVRGGEAKLVLLASDASGNALKKYRDKCSFYNVPVIEKLTRAELGKSIGQPDRVVIAVMEKGFADLIGRGLHTSSEVKDIE